MRDSLVLVGLGNPGIQYVKTRHNAGFRTVDFFAAKFGCECWKRFPEFWLTRGVVSGKRVFLVKPVTYMNNSGEAVIQIRAALNLEVSRLLVIYDDLALPFEKLRIRAKGSDGGHNGVSSIIQYLQTRNFPRLRIGIGAPAKKEQVVDYVLSPFSEKERVVLPQIYHRAVDVAASFIDVGVYKTMNNYN